MTTEHGHREEIRRRFDAELDAIRQGTIRLGSLVLENAQRLTDALLDNRLDLAQAVIDCDDEIDRAYADLEHQVFRLIALQQPVAGDLRLLVAITRMLYEIERSGDLVVNTAKGLLRQQGYQLSSRLKGVLARLCRASSEMFARGIDAISDMDPGAGSRLDREDDTVDALVSEFYTLLAGRAEGLHLDTAIELSRIGRYMERIADHAVNIGEHVSFIVTGTFPPHGTVATSDEG